MWGGNVGSPCQNGAFYRLFALKEVFMAGKKSLVIVGNGMAAGRLLDDLFAAGCEDWRISVIGEEPEGGYNRILLSSVLAKEATAASIISKPHSWFAERGIQFYAGEKVVEVDRERKQVITDNGRAVEYDHLVLTTGSRPSRIGADNQQLQGIMSFRTLGDVSCMERLAVEAGRPDTPPKALVVGGGFLGLEAAYGLAVQGVEVTVVHRSQWLLNRQLDPRAAVFLQRILEHKNIHFLLGCEVQSFEGQTQVTGAKLTNGIRVDCQLAVIATGVTPNTELGREAGLSVNRGVVVDEFMQTSDKSISALGECVEHQGETYGLVDPIWRQSQVLAKHVCGLSVDPFVNQPIATKLKISGVKLFSMGPPIERENQRAIWVEDENAGVYRKCVLEDDRLVGVVLFGDTSGSQFYCDLMQKKSAVKQFSERLVFGPAFFDDAA